MKGIGAAMLVKKALKFGITADRPYYFFSVRYFSGFWSNAFLQPRAQK